MRYTWLVIGLCILAGCNSEQNSNDASAEDELQPTLQTSAEIDLDPNSMQALQDEIKQREQLPGKAHFEETCASCHGGAVQKAPHKDMIGLMTPEAILKALTAGVMQAEASSLSDAEKALVAEYLAGRALGEDIDDIPMCGPQTHFDPLAPALASNWGLGNGNARFISTQRAGLQRQDLAAMQPSWAVRFPGANRTRGQPAFAGGLLFVGSHPGQVYALDQDTGCQVWSYQAAGEVRTGIVISPWGQSDPAPQIFFGDVLGNVYALDAASGKQIWRMRADEHPNATITGTPSLVGDSLYVPISSLEVSLAIDPAYACCTFRGSVLALDTATGEQEWKTYTIEETPGVVKQTSAGTDVIGPSGATVWNSPSIDHRRNQLYIGTGENMSSPATTTSDALFAMDLTTGKVNWVFQATANDAWNVACDTDTPANCPEEDGPDFDFGGATLLVSGSSAGELVIGGQKSGMVHAVNPDNGDLVWQTRVGRGGIQGGVHFGMAASGDRLFVPISDMADGRTYDNPDRPGMHALDINTGKILWSTIHDDRCEGRNFCHPGISQVPTVVGDVVFAGAMDGIARAYDVASGEILWQIDSTQEFDTVLGQTTRGGSFSGGAGPVAFNGKLALSSGYGIYNHMAGNLLLVLSPSSQHTGGD